MGRFHARFEQIERKKTEDYMDSSCRGLGFEIFARNEM